MCDKTHYNNDKEYEIILYETASGRAPFKDFILSLDKTIQAKIIKCVDTLKTMGNSSRFPLTRKINGSIFELRIIQSGSKYRVFYFFYMNKKIILMNGFVKKTNKTPKNELDKANNYMKDWLRRNCNEI